MIDVDHLGAAASAAELNYLAPASAAELNYWILVDTLGAPWGT